MSKTDSQKQLLRLLRFLSANGTCSIKSLTGADLQLVMICAARASRKISCTNACLGLAVADGLVTRAGETVCLSESGAFFLRRAGKGADGYQAQHRQMTTKRIVTGGQVETHRVNVEESPLTRLHARRKADGTPWLDDAHVMAGERLRRDFTIGQLMQKTTSSWDFSGGGGAASKNGKADITDNAIDARRRLDAALANLGPDLAGVLTDVCCCLKGLELVERERQWPPRSAKLMLRTGLELLARHYGTRAGAQSLA